MLFLLLLLLTHTTQSIKFFISSPLYSPKQDLIQQRNVPFAVTVDYKNADSERLSSTFIQVSLRLNNKDFIVKLFRQNFGHQFGETRGIQLSQRNKEQVLLICKTVRLLGIHKDKTQQCAHLHLALRKIMAASMCSHVISHVCVGESCAPFRGGTTAVSVTLTETGVHWLKVVPRYTQPACSLDKQEHIINTPPIRTIVVDCDCPFVSRVVAPTHGSWTLCKSKKEWQHVHMVRTRQHLVGCKHAQDSDKEREREQDGRVCMRSKNMSFCGEQGASAATLEMFVASPSSVTLKSWWDEPEGRCTNITTITTFNTYTTNATYNNRPNVEDPNGLELIVLTGLNDKYINNLKQLVGSMVLYNPTGTIEIVDLGLSNQSIAAIKAWTTPTMNITIIPFHFEKYPPHVHDLSTYAFKILAIQEGLTRHPSGLLWIDAGRVTRTLSRAWREIASDEGMFFLALLPTSSGIHPFPWGNSAYHHNETMKRVGLESVNVKQTQCDGAVQGWSKHGSFYNKAFPMLVKCALDVHCITPIGSNRQNHLQDQTVLNAVFSKLKVDPCKGNKLFDSEYNSEYNTMRHMDEGGMFRRSYPLARDVFELYLENSEEHQSMVGIEGGAPLECHKDDDPKYSCKHVVHSENISITNLLGVTEHSLFTIRGCDLHDPVTLAKQFLQRWKGVGRFSHILSTVLDKVCGGIQGVRCKKGTELIHDHFDIGEVIIHTDSNIMTVVKQKFQETNTRSSMYAVLRQICERLRYACFKQQTLGISRKPLSLELDSTFDGREMDFATTMETLTNIATVAAVEAGESGIEGNLWVESIPQQSTSHDRIPRNTEDHERIEQARRKRECTIFAMGVQYPPPRTFLEVGFNAGHSLALFLHFVPSIEHVYEFDLCNHAYTVSNFEVVKTSAPHVQMSLTCGNSRATLAAAARAKTMGKVDAIHIDGGHDFDTAWADITNAGHFATESTLLMIDDVHDTSSLEGAASAAIDGGIIELLGGFSAACRYGSVFGRYTKEFLNSLKENESD